MACEYCDRDGCLAYATLGGFHILIGDDRILAEIGCRNATRDRALRAEAVVDAGLVTARRIISARRRYAKTKDDGPGPFSRGAMAVRDAMVEAKKAWEESK